MIIKLIFCHSFIVISNINNHGVYSILMFIIMSKMVEKIDLRSLTL